MSTLLHKFSSLGIPAWAGIQEMDACLRRACPREGVGQDRRANYLCNSAMSPAKERKVDQSGETIVCLSVYLFIDYRSPITVYRSMIEQLLIITLLIFIDASAYATFKRRHVQVLGDLETAVNSPSPPPFLSIKAFQDYFLNWRTL